MSQPETPRLKKNNFDLLRLIFAATVCFVHADELSGYAKIGWISQVLSSEVAVKAFFVVSGFLIFMSYERSSSLATYFIKRVRRIYPAYVTVIPLATRYALAVSFCGVVGYAGGGFPALARGGKTLSFPGQSLHFKADFVLRLTVYE